MKTIAGVEAERELGRALIFGKSVRVEQKLEELGEDESPQTLRTVIPFTLKSLDEETRTIEFVGSSAAKDRYGDEIVQAGWEIGNFLGNPVVPWGHDYSMPPVAKALEVGIKEGNLTFKAQFATADEYAWADTIYKLYKGGYLRAFSVGFIPLDYDGNWETGYTFTKCELLEVSCVTVPANPEALVLSFQEGVLSEDERKLMIGKAQQLIKTLTESSGDPHIKNMETANAKEIVTELRDNLSALVNSLSELTEIVSKNVEPEPEGGEEADVVVEAEPEAGEPGQDAPGGTEEGADETTEEVETEAPGMTAEELKAAVQVGVREQLDYELGKIK